MNGTALNELIVLVACESEFLQVKAAAVRIIQRRKRACEIWWRERGKGGGEVSSLTKWNYSRQCGKITPPVSNAPKLSLAHIWTSLKKTVKSGLRLSSDQHHGGDVRTDTERDPGPWCPDGLNRSYKGKQRNLWSMYQFNNGKEICSLSENLLCLDNEWAASLTEVEHQGLI